MLLNSLIILCFLLTFTGIAATNPNLLGDQVFINCGSNGASTAVSGREWLGDVYPKFSSSVEIKGSSSRAGVVGELMISVDPVPYRTARISRSQFSYTFQLNPGQKFIRLHFYPTSYNGFQRFNDLFTVEAGPFTLLTNFSASITADALAVSSFAKEFCIITQENQPLNIVFSPATSQSQDTYAFINGIEVISVSNSLPYCHGGDIGVQVVGDKSVIYIGNSTALEMVHRQNIKWGSVSSGDDITGMFGMLATILKEKANKVSNMTWRISVDVGFRYLVRIHFCEIGLKMMQAGGKDFMLLINHMVASTSADILQERENDGSFWYKNYMVMVEGQKREGKRDIFISLPSKHEFLDRHSPLEGFEVFKLSNHDNSLASPNPPPPIRNSPSQTIQMLPLLGRHKISIVLFTIICLANFIVYMLRQTWGDNFTEEEKMPSARVKRLCRRFSLAEIQSATENFYDAFFIGRGGFGKVYKGLMDNGQLSVAIKRLKPDSNQGEHQFWTEVEMLSELRHVNLVPLIGYCNEQREMILVYEYMRCGTLADHLYKLSRKGKDYHSLSWKQRLKICIGAGRGLDYLHTGHGIIHRDVKASNILLDEKFVAKVSDFGLAKTGSRSELESDASTNIKGTLGHIDPDYCRTHKITTKSDIYSFGVVLLEVLCGRPAVEQWVEEEKRSLTVWARDNISNGQVDQIVAPSLREEISPDSLKTFVRIAEKCLHDEPKRRPAIAHIVIILELALEQQENAESLALIVRASVADVFPSTDKSQKETTSSSVSNERIDIADVLAQEGNARSLLSNEITNVADALPCTSKPQHESAKSLSPNEKKSIADALPGDNRTTISVSTILKAAFNNVQNVTSFLRKQINSKMIDSGKRGERKSIMQKLSRKLLPWDAFRITRKSSKKMDLVSHALSAPILRTDKSQLEKAKSLSRCEKTSIAVALPGNVRAILSKSTKLRAASPSVQNRTSLLREQMKSNVINSGKIDERKSTMHKLSGKLWPGDAFWNTKRLSKEKDLVSHALSGAVSEKMTTNMTSSSGSSAVSGNGRCLVASGSDEASPNASGQMLPKPNLRIFTFSELKTATRNFRSDTVLGEGGFGKVYKGWLDKKASGTGSGTVIAVKKLNSESMQGFQEWQSELNFLGRLSHPNLVKLLGYCWEDKELLLIYEFMAKGSLENHLFGRGSAVRPLPWDIRLKILIGAARGLAFLHASDRKVIYRDFKASNILLDASYHAKLSDFGLAKMGPTGSQSHVTTQVMGTYGYAAPEYVATGHLYVKSDVYGFGVVLVEMLTGLRAMDLNRPSGQHNLVDWIKPHLSGRRKLKKIIDSRLEGRYPSRSALQQIAQLALNCLEGEPRNRPSMQEVVEMLERTKAVEKPRQPRVHFDLGNFDGNQYPFN